jgi:hypothetical protein
LPEDEYEEGEEYAEEGEAAPEAATVVAPAEDAAEAG